MDINNLSFSEIGTYKFDSSQLREISLDMGKCCRLPEVTAGELELAMVCSCLFDFFQAPIRALCAISSWPEVVVISATKRAMSGRLLVRTDSSIGKRKPVMFDLFSWLFSHCWLRRWAYSDCVEFIESSLDANLAGSHIKLRFKNTPVLNKLSIHETADQVIILIATVASVHRLVLPHPKKLSAIILVSRIHCLSKSRQVLIVKIIHLCRIRRQA